MKDATKFKYLFWFCTGVFACSFGAMMLLLLYPIPDSNREMASNAQGFLQGSLMMSAIGFLLTGNIYSAMGKPKGGNSAELGATTAEFTASVTTEPIDKPEDNG